jgi:hypothetical protein
MGLLEAVVVLYVRHIYFPRGFAFPIPAVAPGHYRAEIVREAATLVMLGTVAWQAAPRPWSRFQALLVVWGAWDLAYYLGLLVLLDWPPGLLTDDLLFLIPIPWVGPVAAPALVAATWVAAGLLLHRVPVERVAPRPWEWGAGSLGCALILASFMIPWGPPEDPGFLWVLYLAGYLLGAFVLARFVTRRSA